MITAGDGWWAADAVVTLLSQVTTAYPRRDTASDGIKGDRFHTTGDHVPDPDSQPPNVVRAIDIDADLKRSSPLEMRRLTNQMRRHCQKGDDQRVGYIIYSEQIAGPWTGWLWIPYTGPNPHTTHGHFSFTENGDHRGRPFPLEVFA